MRTAILISAIVMAAAMQNTSHNGSISGRLTLRNGGPAANRRVHAIAGQPAKVGSASIVSTTNTDSQGRFLLEGVPPGRYVIGTGELEAVMFYPGTAEVNQATVVTVASDEKVTNVDFQLTTVRVSGRIVGDLSPLFGVHGRGGGGGGPRTAELRLGPGPNAPGALVEQGRGFLFSAVQPGTYQPRFTNGQAALISGPLVIGNDDINDLQLQVARSMSFPVNVAVSGGGTAPSLRLRFEVVKPIVTPAPVMEAVATGSLDMTLPDTQYRLVLPETPPGLSVKSATLVYPSGGTTSILQKPFQAHQVARLDIVLERSN